MVNSASREMVEQVLFLLFVSFQVLTAGPQLTASTEDSQPDTTPLFEDCTEAMGLQGLPNNAASWVDFNNDGWVDLYVNGTLWRNRKGLEFIRMTEGGPRGNGGIWADFDNDGWWDLFCWGNHKLFRNLGGKSFEDVTALMAELPSEVSRSAVWGDFDRDSWVDLYIGGYEIWDQDREFPDVQVRNEEGKGFKQVWISEQVRRARGVTAADFDEDGDLDIYVSNYRLQPNSLWVNDGHGTFHEEAQRYRLRVEGDELYGHTIGSAWGDFDNDGHLDLFVGNFSHPSPEQDRPLFFRNRGPDGEFHFENRSDSSGLQWQESYASPALADFDNDGLLDLFLTTVYPNDHSVLLRNRGGWRFEDVTSSSGVRTEPSYQAAWADFDNDGDLDLVTGGRLFRNRTDRGHWLKVRLVGSRNVNRSAIGAVVRVEQGGEIISRQVESTTGEGNQNDPTLHFGLGGHLGEVEIRISWPDQTAQRVVASSDQILICRHAGVLGSGAGQ